MMAKPSLNYKNIIILSLKEIMNDDSFEIKYPTTAHCITKQNVC